MRDEISFELEDPFFPDLYTRRFQSLSPALLLPTLCQRAYLIDRGVGR